MSKHQLAHHPAKSPARDILLSIVTVARNDHKRLATTISSLERFYGDDRFEHIVIDGNSNDDTQLLLKEKCRHTNFKCQSESDDGIYDAMNKGSGLSAGRFILYLNCGDKMFVSPEEINSWLRPLAIKNNADIVCFYSRVQDGTDATTLIPKLAWPYRMPTSHQAMVFSTEFVRANPYDTRYKIAADFDLYLKADKARVIFFSGVGHLTAIEADGVASINPIQSYREYLHAAQKNLSGRVKWRAVVRIWLKATGVILLKNTLPRSWVAALRRHMQNCQF